MKNHSTSKRLSRAVVCGLVGVLVLSVSAFAAYGSTSGYGKYKDAVKDLIVNVDNVSYQATTAVKIDGKTINKWAVAGKIDDGNSSVHEKSVGGNNGNSEYYSTTLNGVSTSFSVKDETYSQYEAEESSGILSLGESSDKIAKFGSLLADTLLGDLKNNVVLVSEEDGISNYKLDISAEQVPPLINAGLDVVGISENSLGYTEYEDSEATYASFYQEKTGTALADDYFDQLYSDENSDNTAMWNQYTDNWDEMDQKYQSIIDDKYNGDAIVYVHADGTYTVYTSYDEYAEATAVSNDVSNYLSSNSKLSNVVCTVALDKDNHLIDNGLILSFTKVDSKGKSHTVDFELNIHLSDYGKTKVTALDTGSRTLEANN